MAKCYEAVGVSKKCSGCIADMAQCGEEMDLAKCGAKDGEIQKATECFMDNCMKKFYTCTDGEKIADCAMDTKTCIYEKSCTNQCNMDQIVNNFSEARAQECLTCAKQKCLPEYEQCAKKAENSGKLGAANPNFPLWPWSGNNL